MLEQKIYTTPTKKLLQFFENSRDLWKGKYTTLRKEYQILKNKVNALEASNEKWKNEALEARKNAKKANIKPKNKVSEPLKKKS